jgi:uncharacterized hydrophobic protein (TIGR00271 family)
MRPDTDAAMLHLNLVTPASLAAPVLEYLERSEFVVNVVHMPNAAKKPAGDVIACDVAREEGSAVIEALRAMGCDARGTISVESLDVVLSESARQAERRAAGSPADAVVWESVVTQTSDSADLSVAFLSFMVLATMIASIGILTDSIVLIIGGMVVGPEFGPLAGLCVGVVQRRFDLARRSALALVVGFPMAIVLSYCMTLLLVELGAAPASAWSPNSQTLFISNPDVFSVLIAIFSGIVGMLSLTTSKSSALIGVLISVTTIPAAAGIAVAAARRDTEALAGAAAQLGINLVMLLTAGLLTLAAQRLAFMRRVRSDGTRTPAPSKGA